MCALFKATSELPKSTPPVQTAAWFRAMICQNSDCLSLFTEHHIFKLSAIHMESQVLSLVAFELLNEELPCFVEGVFLHGTRV
jgi:hypothetical protein